MPPTRRRGSSPDADALSALARPPAAGGRLRKAPVADPVLGTSGRAAEPVATVTRVKQPRVTGGKEKVGFYQLGDDTARARAAYDWTRPQEGHRSFSDFIASAVMREVARLETKYHQGEAWPAVAPGQLPTGKPLGS
jgi:Centromere-binding protein ParB C-terminal